MSFDTPNERPAVSYFVTTEGGIRFRELTEPKSPDALLAGQVFLGDGFGVLEIKRNARLLHRPDHEPAWLEESNATGAPRVTASRTFITFSNSFIEHDPPHIGTDGGRLGWDEDEDAWQLVSPTQAGPLCRFSLKGEHEPVDVGMGGPWLSVLPG